MRQGMKSAARRDESKCALTHLHHGQELRRGSFHLATRHSKTGNATKIDRHLWSLMSCGAGYQLSLVLCDVQELAVQGIAHSVQHSNRPVMLAPVAE